VAVIGNEETIATNGQRRQQVEPVLEVFRSEWSRSTIEYGTSKPRIENDGAAAAFSERPQRIAPEPARSIDEGGGIEHLVHAQQTGSA
jgi:hypothetical protein